MKRTRFSGVFSPLSYLFNGFRLWTQNISFRKILADVEELPELVDKGWRYLPLKHKNEESCDEPKTNIHGNQLPANFFIWRTDNFWVYMLYHFRYQYDQVRYISGQRLIKEHNINVSIHKNTKKKDELHIFVMCFC